MSEIVYTQDDLQRIDAQSRNLAEKKVFSLKLLAINAVFGLDDVRNTLLYIIYKYAYECTCGTIYKYIQFHRDSFYKYMLKVVGADYQVNNCFSPSLFYHVNNPGNLFFKKVKHGKAIPIESVDTDTLYAIMTSLKFDNYYIYEDFI